jgi:hypothetical protein
MRKFRIPLVDFMTPLEQSMIARWREAADDLGFRFEAPFTLQDGN